MIYIVHFCARFQKFCSGGGSNSYEKAFFAPLIWVKYTYLSVYFCPPGAQNTKKSKFLCSFNGLSCYFFMLFVFCVCVCFCLPFYGCSCVLCFEWCSTVFLCFYDFMFFIILMGFHVSTNLSMAFYGCSCVCFYVFGV